VRYAVIAAWLVATRSAQAPNAEFDAVSIKTTPAKHSTVLPAFDRLPVRRSSDSAHPSGVSGVWRMAILGDA